MAIRMYFDGRPVAPVDHQAFDAYIKHYGFEPPNERGLYLFIQQVRKTQVFKYQDGSMASNSDRAERNAFRAFYQLTGHPPQSRGALLAWARKNNPKSISKLIGGI